MSRKKKNKGLKHYIQFFILLILIAIAWFAYVNRKPIYRNAWLFYHNHFGRNHNKPPSKLESAYALGVPLPANYSVFGTDISRHQGKINWEKLSGFRFEGHKIEFVFIKASEGETWQDEQFEHNWKKAKKHHVLRGAYHFYNPKVNSKIQMKNFTNVVKMEKGDLPPVLDVEIESSLPKKTYRAGVLNCLKIMESTYGMKPIIYTNQKLYHEYFKPKAFQEYRFWISRLRNTPPKMKKWHFWQFTYEAVIDGTNEYVDINAFNGSKQQLINMTKK